MKISAPHLWIGGILLGMGTAATLTYRRCDAKIDTPLPLEQPISIAQTESYLVKEEKQPSPTGISTRNAFPLEERTREYSGALSPEQIYQGMRQFFLSRSINELYTFQGFARTLESYKDGGLSLQIKDLRALLDNKDISPNLAKLFGSHDAFERYVHSFDGNGPDTTIKDALVDKGRFDIPITSLDSLASDLWTKKGGQEVWEVYREKTFLPEIAANYEAQMHLGLPVRSFGEYLSPLVRQHQAAGKVSFTGEQIQKINTAISSYDTTVARLPTLSKQEQEKAQASLNELEGAVYQALMPDGEEKILYDIANRIDDKNLANLILAGYCNNVLRNRKK